MPDEFQNFLLDITSLTQFVNFKSFRFWNKNKISEYASRIATKKSFQQQNGRKNLELGDVNTELCAQRYISVVLWFYTFISMGYGQSSVAMTHFGLCGFKLIVSILFVIGQKPC